MKISNSKKELARIISENGGWRNGEFAAQDGDGGIGGYEVKPEWDSLAKYWWREASGQWFFANKIKNHHQTVLSRAEYFHLYPAPDAGGWIEWNGGECPVDGGEIIDIRFPDSREEFGTKAKFRRWCHGGDSGDIIAYRLHKPEQSTVESRLADAVDIVKSAVPALMRDDMKFTGDEAMGERKPTIEQLAADYRSAKDYAERKQKDADDAKADADEKLRVLEIAGEALGLLVSPITAKQEPKLVITDWRQWRVGDVVSWSLLNHVGELEIISVHHDQSRNIGDFEVKDKPGDVYRVYGDECRFIRRP